jgi:hypothetical protein
MDCAPVPKLIEGPGWVYEIKLDGYRAVAVKSDRGVNLFSRRHKSFNHQYPYLPGSTQFQFAPDPIGRRERTSQVPIMTIAETATIFSAQMNEI